MARRSRKSKQANTLMVMPIIWHCGSYCRLSDDDHTGKISNSIGNQSILTRDFINQCPEAVFTAEFIDDGKSGTTFSRNGFNQMIKEIMAGRINCVVVKDLSRLGRNYIDTEDYITKVFPFLGVRFIAVNDNIDTMAPDFDEKLLHMRLKNLTNDLYAKQVSQNVGQAFDEMGEEGIYHGPVPPYGYLICCNNSDRRHLVIDKEVVEIPKLIFSRFLNGESLYAITKYLNDNNIVPPMRHFSDLGLYRSNCHSKETRWYKSTVKLILENPAYCGCLAVKRHNRSLYKGIPNHKIPKEEWKFVLNTHEAIISIAVYGTVQKMLEIKKVERAEKAISVDGPRTVNIYAGKMRCGCCGRPLKRDYFKNRKGGRSFYQCCEDYKYKNTMSACKSCYINEDKLGGIISELLYKYSQLFLEKTQILDVILKDTGLNADIDEAKLIITELDSLGSQKMLKKKELYADLKVGILSQDEYLFAKAQYENEINQVKAQRSGAEQYLNLLNKRLDSIYHWEKCLKGNSWKMPLSKELIDNYIVKITVSSSSRIEIEFTFMDAFRDLCTLVKEGEEDYGRAVSY